MRREIKFRFWVDGVNGKFMIYPDNRKGAGFNSEGWEFHLDYEGFDIINHMGAPEPAHHIPMQYTGLKDKNGTEIYEEDIVKAKTPYSDESTEEVTWQDLMWGVGTEPLQSFIKYNAGGVAVLAMDRGYSLEVIGNAYQNKELIKEMLK